MKDLKAYKNSAEAKGMRNSQIKDALVWVRLVHRIEKGVRERINLFFQVNEILVITGAGFYGRTKSKFLATGAGASQAHEQCYE